MPTEIPLFVLASVYGPGYGLIAALQPGEASQACSKYTQSKPCPRMEGRGPPLRCSVWEARQGCVCKCACTEVLKSSAGSTIIESVSPATRQCKYFIYLTHLIPTRAPCGGDCHSSRFATNRSNALCCRQSAQVRLPTAAGAHPELSTSLPPIPPTHPTFPSHPSPSNYPLNIPGTSMSLYLSVHDLSSAWNTLSPLVHRENFYSYFKTQSMSPFLRSMATPTSRRMLCSLPSGPTASCLHSVMLESAL